VFGSSLTFYQGRKFHEDLIAQVAKATGKTATTQSAGLLDGLKTINAKRVAVATAYTDEVTARLKVFLEEHGYVVTSAQGLGFVSIPEGGATHDILFQLGASCYDRSQKADALVMSCGRLNTLDLLVPLEGKIGVPVVSSTPHGLMNGVRLLKTVSPKAKGFGTVFEKA
jgi:arylmalonate decarboxylase